MTYEEKKEWLQRYKVARQLFSFRLQQQQRRMPGTQLKTFHSYPAELVMVKPCRGQLNVSKRQRNA